MSAPFSVGSTICRLASDGWMAFPPEFLFASVPQPERDEALQGLTDGRGMIRAACQALLVHAAGTHVLVDSGYGDAPLRAEHPDWLLAVELAAGATVERTRPELLGRAAREHCTVAGSPPSMRSGGGRGRLGLPPGRGVVGAAVEAW